MTELELLTKQVTDLREMLEAKYSPEKQKEEKDKLFQEIMDKVHPPKRTMRFGPSNESPEGKTVEKAIADGKMPTSGVYLGQIIRAVANKDHGFLSEAGLKTEGLIMTEGTPAQGGYAVPVEYGNAIIRLEQAASILRRLARPFPMGSLTRRLPRQLTNVVVSWVDEAAVKPLTKPTLEPLTQTAKKMAAVVKFTDELLEDNNVDIDQFIMELIAEAMGLEEDRVGFAGNTGVGDPFMGVLYAAGVTVATMAGANLTFDDLVDQIMALNAAYRAGATLVMSTMALQVIMKIKDAQGRYIWQVPGEGQIPRIWTYPYEISDQIPTNLGVGTSTAILFGNWKKRFFVSDRGPYEVYSSKDAGDFTTQTSAFMSDETWSRFKKRMSLDVALPVAFSRMLVK